MARATPFALCGALVLVGCAPPHRDDAPRRDRSAVSEPIGVRVGTREVQVRCALDCEPARRQLTTIRDGCVADPTSTPHHLDPASALVALGCCTEAATAYRRACEDDTLAACVSRWSAECESGRIPPP